MVFRPRSLPSVSTLFVELRVEPVTDRGRSERRRDRVRMVEIGVDGKKTQDHRLRLSATSSEVPVGGRGESVRVVRKVGHELGRSVPLK